MSAPIFRRTAEMSSSSGSTRTTSFRSAHGGLPGMLVVDLTLTMRVEATLKAMVPEIRFVEAVP